TTGLSAAVDDSHRQKPTTSAAKIVSPDFIGASFEVVLPASSWRQPTVVHHSDERECNLSRENREISMTRLFVAFRSAKVRRHDQRCSKPPCDVLQRKTHFRGAKGDTNRRIGGRGTHLPSGGPCVDSPQCIA